MSPTLAWPKDSRDPTPHRVKKALAHLLGAVGNRSRLASLLGVRESDLVDWVDDNQQPNRKQAGLLVDFDVVLTQAEKIWSKRAAVEWIAGPNSYLGSRPADALRVKGLAPVKEALNEAAKREMS